MGFKFVAFQNMGGGAKMLRKLKLSTFSKILVTLHNYEKRKLVQALVEDAFRRLLILPALFAKFQNFLHALQHDCIIEVYREFSKMHFAESLIFQCNMQNFLQVSVITFCKNLLFLLVVLQNVSCSFKNSPSTFFITTCNQKNFRYILFISQIFH